MVRRALLVLALACGQPQAPTIPDVQGSWVFVGVVSYGGPTWCADTLTVRFSQDDQHVTGEATEWHFTCSNGDPMTGPRLLADGILTTDSIGLRWTTDSSHHCALCLAFVMFGSVDTIMAGWYHDLLGGNGVWRARRP